MRFERSVTRPARRRAWLALPVAMALALAACGSNDTKSAGGPAASTSSGTGGAGGGTATTAKPADPALPTAKIVATESGDAYTYQAPTELPAGKVLVELTNNGKLEHQATFAKLKQGVTYAQVDEVLKGPNAATALAFVQLYGGPNAVGAGKTGKVVVDLTPGEYYIVCAIPDDKGTPHISHGMVQKVTVGGSGSSGTTATTAGKGSTAEIPTAGTITLHDFSVELPAGFTGQGWYAVANEGKQPHEAAAYQLAPGKTASDFTTFQEQADNAAQGKGSPPLTQPPITPAGGVAAADPGITQWVYLDLDKANNYIFVCFIPDVSQGFKPHWMEGMITPWPSPGGTSATTAKK